MIKIKSQHRVLFLLIVAFILCASAHSQNKWKYISPVPGSKYINPGNNIALRHGDIIDRSSLICNVILVRNENGDHIDGRVKLSDDSRTLIFTPYSKFKASKLIQVEVQVNVRLVDGKIIEDTAFSFQISGKKEKAANTDAITSCGINDADFEQLQNYGNMKISRKDFSGLQADDLPEDYPSLEITHFDHPSPGYTFLTSSKVGNYNAYLRIVDNYGIPVFYKKFNGKVSDLKVVSGNSLLHALNENSGSASKCYLLMDDKYRVTDTLRMKNGYRVDTHDALVLEDGSRLMMAYDAQLVGMDTVVPDGDPQATVVGLVIQEIDPDENVVFQWRSWDHFSITDAVGVDFTSHYIDYVHGNALEIDFDGHILISSRHLNEITKINRNTGEVIWRFGPNAKNNMFIFTNDSIGFSYQHDVRRAAEGTITLYDNGNLHDPQFSRALEYEVDEEAFTATQVWKYVNDPVVYAGATGSTRRLHNGHTLVGWGSVPPESPIFTEISEDGEKKWEAFYPDWVHSYRVVKDYWESTAFDLNKDSLNCGEAQPGDTAIGKLKITNNLDHQIEINKLLSRTGCFFPSGNFPLTIAANQKEEIQIGFTSDTIGVYHDVLTICNDVENNTLTQRIARQIDVTAEITEDASVGEINLHQIKIFPNPVSDVLNIIFAKKLTGRLTLFTLNGNMIMQKNIEGIKHDVINLSGLSSGMYFVQFTDCNGRDLIAKKIIRSAD